MALNDYGWRELIRRALRIPDVIGDEVTMEIITDVVFSAPVVREKARSADGVTEQRISRAVLDRTIEAAARGDLDRFIVGRDGAGRSSVVDVRSVDAAITLAVRESGENVPPGLAEPLLMLIRDYVLTHPFEAANWPHINAVP
ncbi:MAG: hypothetical protein ACLP9C_03045 [Acidimicrobiales bacterium]